jgi:hypothetical protein
MEPPGSVVVPEMMVFASNLLTGGELIGSLIHEDVEEQGVAGPHQEPEKQERPHSDSFRAGVTSFQGDLFPAGLSGPAQHIPEDGSQLTPLKSQIGCRSEPEGSDALDVGVRVTLHK